VKGLDGRMMRESDRGHEQITQLRVLTVHFTIYCNGDESKEGSMGGLVAYVEEMRNAFIIFGKVRTGKRLLS
jgi:hypothetical protein